MCHHPGWLRDHDQVRVNVNDLNVIWFGCRDRAVVKGHNVPFFQATRFAQTKCSVDRDLRSGQPQPELRPGFTGNSDPHDGQYGLANMFDRDRKRNGIVHDERSSPLLVVSACGSELDGSNGSHFRHPITRLDHNAICKRAEQET